MIFSEKFLAFLKANAPQTKNFPIPEAVEGLSRKDKEDRIAFTRWSSGTAYSSVFFSKEKEIEVKWILKIEDKKDLKKIFFEPRIYGTGSESSGGGATNPVEFILGQLGIEKKVEVELPEPMTQIPIPPWMGHDYSGQGDWPNQEMASKICFASEAKQMIAEFEKELGKIKEELK